MYTNPSNASMAPGLSFGNSTAAMVGMSCGITITDPRLQPFMEALREEHVQFNAQVFMSNGFSRNTAYAEAEKITGDRSQFYNQALIKYLESLSDPKNKVPPTKAEPVPQIQQPQEFNYYNHQLPQQPSVHFNNMEPTSNQIFSQFFNLGNYNAYAQKIAAYKTPYMGYPYYGNTVVPTPFSPPVKAEAPIKTETVIPKSQPIIKFNIFNSRKSRFDVPASVPAASPQISASRIFASMFNKPVTEPAPPIIPQQSNQKLERLIQQWTYRVFSQMQAHEDSKNWRSLVCDFVSKHTTMLRSVYSNSNNSVELPYWLTSCIVPTVSEILGTVPDSFILPPLNPPSSAPPPLPSIEIKKYNKKSKKQINYLSSKDSDSEQSDKSSTKKSTGFWLSQNNPSYTKPKRNFKYKPKASPVFEQDTEVVTVEELKRRGDRLRRFGLDDCVNNNPTESSSLPWQEKMSFLSSLKRVIGESTQLEKPYHRLCGPVNPQDVRPEAILKKSLDHCLKKFEETQQYSFIEKQFRSIRQDLTVQGIRNEFTVKVYEKNAEIAIENYDLGQFNQCQTQLRELHKHIHSNQRTLFLCYRLLYLSLTNMRQDCLNLLGELYAENLVSPNIPDIYFALNFRKTLIEGNFARLFRMKNQAPCLSKYLIQLFNKRLKMMYLYNLAKSHYTLSINFLKETLFFKSLEDCRQFLMEQDAVWMNNEEIDCRKSVNIFENSPLLQNKKLNALG